MTVPENVNLAMHLILSTAMGVMLWRLCYNSRSTMGSTPQLWAAGFGFAMAWMSQSLPQLVTGQPLTPGLLLVDYGGIVLAQGLAMLYLWLSRRPQHHPLTPLAAQASVLPRPAGYPHLVLLTEADGPAPAERSRDYDDYTLKLVA